MRYLKSLVLMLSILITAVSALAVANDENTPDAWFAYDNIETRTDLDIEPEPTTGNLSLTPAPVIRTPITICGRDPLGKCTQVDNQFSFSWNLASVIKKQFDFRDCESITSTVLNGKFKFTYYATGNRCNTTARDSTIAGAINHFLEKVANHEICGTVCLKLNHEGTWDGWLKIGETGRFKEKAYCGEQLEFGNCATGGNNDI
jgi:hypothetical protein